MARPRLLQPKGNNTVRLPVDLLARILSDLYSPVEGRVPYRAWSEFIEMCVREHYARLDDAARKRQLVCTDAESGGQPPRGDES